MILWSTITIKTDSLKSTLFTLLEGLPAFFEIFPKI